MRYLAAAIIGSGVLCGPAQATTSTQPQVWQGTAFVASVTPACTKAGAATVGDYGVVVYRPIIAGSAANTGSEGLTFVTGRSVLHYFTPSASNQSFRSAGTADITYINGLAQSPLAAGTGAYSLKFTPATPSLTSPQIFIIGKLGNFWDITGCTVGFTASLDRRID